MSKHQRVKGKLKHIQFSLQASLELVLVILCYTCKQSSSEIYLYMGGTSQTYFCFGEVFPSIVDNFIFIHVQRWWHVLVMHLFIKKVTLARTCSLSQVKGCLMFCKCRLPAITHVIMSHILFVLLYRIVVSYSVCNSSSFIITTLSFCLSQIVLLECKVFTDLYILFLLSLCYIWYKSKKFHILINC